MIDKRPTTLKTLYHDIAAFYTPEAFHFLGINALNNDDGGVEVQWIFAHYGARDVNVMFYTHIQDDALIPSLNSLIPSAWIGERELIDLFGLRIDGMEAGLMLDSDSLNAPLRIPKGEA